MKKAQAALEFMATYGWAILVLIISISVLAMSGILSPDKFMQGSCFVVAGIGCDDFKVSSDGSAIIMLRNNLGLSMYDVIVDIKGIQGSDSCSGYMRFEENCTYSWPSGTFNDLTSGGRFSETLNVTYTQEDGVRHTREGTLRLDVE